MVKREDDGRQGGKGKTSHSSQLQYNTMIIHLRERLARET